MFREFSLILLENGRTFLRKKSFQIRHFGIFFGFFLDFLSVKLAAIQCVRVSVCARHVICVVLLASYYYWPLLLLQQVVLESFFNFVWISSISRRRSRAAQEEVANIICRRICRISVEWKKRNGPSRDVCVLLLTSTTMAILLLPVDQTIFTNFDDALELEVVATPVSHKR